MKTRSILLTSALVALSFASCSNDDDNTNNGKSPVIFNSSIKAIDGSVTSKASNNSWDAGDAIGIFMKRGTGLSGIVDNAENKRYVTTGAGNFSPANINSESIYFPSDGNLVDFIAYYPYKATSEVTSNIYKVDVASQTLQVAIDLLYSNDATGLTESGNVALGFTHQLTKLVFNIKGDSNIPSLAGLVTTLDGLNTKADFDLATGVLSNESTPAIITALTTVGTSTTAEAIILPSTAVAGRKFIFTLPAGTFTYEVPASTTYAQGMKYTFDVELKNGGKTEVTSTGTITDWGVGGNTDIEIDLGAGEGSQASPYSVSLALTKSGETGKWITGYIVGSTSKTKSFGPDVNTNILLGASATETDETKCIIVDLDGSAVQDNLDIVANPTLKGKLVKVQGDIVNTLFGATVAVTGITAQEGGATSGGGSEEEFFSETFGTVEKVGTFWPKVAAFTGYDMQSPIVYSDQYGNSDIRSTSTLSANVWLPKDKDAELSISGFSTSYKSVTITFELASNTLNQNASAIQVLCDGTPATTQPNYEFTATNKYQEFSTTIPDGTAIITFVASATTNKAGYRIDNIKMKGTK